jgi:hypothetical protein
MFAKDCKFNLKRRQHMSSSYEIEENSLNSIMNARVLSFWTLYIT